MPVVDQVRSVARREYDLVRSCVGLVERRVVTPLAGERVGGLVHYAADVVDSYADRLLGTAHGSAVGASRPTRPGRATAADRPHDPSPTEEASDPVDEGVDEDVEELAEDYLEAEEGHLVGELADNEDLRRVQAELRARHTLEHDEPAEGWPDPS